MKCALNEMRLCSDLAEGLVTSSQCTSIWYTLKGTAIRSAAGVSSGRWRQLYQLFQSLIGSDNVVTRTGSFAEGSEKS